MAAQRLELQTLQHKLNSEQRLNRTKLDVATAKIKELQRQLASSTEHLKGFDVEIGNTASSLQKDRDLKKLNALLREKLVASEEDLYIAKQRAEAFRNELESLKKCKPLESLESGDVDSSEDRSEVVPKGVFMALQVENEKLRQKVQELHAKKKRLDSKLITMGTALRSSTPTPKPGVRTNTQNGNGLEKKNFRPSTTFCIRGKNRK